MPPPAKLREVVVLILLLPPLMTGASCPEWVWRHSVLGACGSGNLKARNERTTKTSERPMSVSQATGMSMLSDHCLQIRTNRSLRREAYQSSANFSQLVFNHTLILHNFLSPICPFSSTNRQNKGPTGVFLGNVISNSYIK